MTEMKMKMKKMKIKMTKMKKASVLEGRQQIVIVEVLK